MAVASNGRSLGRRRRVPSDYGTLFVLGHAASLRVAMALLLQLPALVTTATRSINRPLRNSLVMLVTKTPGKVVGLTQEHSG